MPSLPSSPSSANLFGASLLQKSKANPGSVDMSIFQKKGGGQGGAGGSRRGEGTTSSDYLEKTRQENPDVESNARTESVSLSNCRIATDPAKLAVNQPFEMSVDLKGDEGAIAGSITFNLFCVVQKADGGEEIQDLSASTQASAKSGTVVVEGRLVGPKSPVDPGTILKYYAVAQHPNATEKSESTKVDVQSDKIPQPLAVWSLGAVHFGFDSSFILPSSKAELAELKAMCDQHAGAGFAVFAHADPTGNDAYNKGLSGRRAFSAYCLLTKNVDGWVELSKGADGDRWDLRTTQSILAHLENGSRSPYYEGSIDGKNGSKTEAAIKAFQQSKGLKPDGVAGPLTKAKLYGAYMAGICAVDLAPDDFLGDPADGKRQWACVGCGESNPARVFSKADDDKFRTAADKRERDAKNATNRRAVVMLFPPGAKGPGKVAFPCPAWTDGVAKCKGQLFDDADKRRNPSSAERTWKADKDTFGCRFYAGIAKDEGEAAGAQQPRTENNGGYAEVPVYETHFDDGHFLPNLATDEFLEALAGVVEYHRQYGQCPLEIHSEVGSVDPEILEKRLKLAESIVHGDESAWASLVQNATISDVQQFLRYFASKGWHCDPGPVDGKDGPRTIEGIFQFQHACNHAWKMKLTTDGICGPKTWNGILRTLRGLVGSDV